MLLFWSCSFWNERWSANRFIVFWLALNFFFSFLPSGKRPTSSLMHWTISILCPLFLSSQPIRKCLFPKKAKISTRIAVAYSTCIMRTSSLHQHIIPHRSLSIYHSATECSIHGVCTAKNDETAKTACRGRRLLWKWRTVLHCDSAKPQRKCPGQKTCSKERGEYEADKISTKKHSSAIQTGRENLI